MWAPFQSHLGMIVPWLLFSSHLLALYYPLSTLGASYGVPVSVFSMVVQMTNGKSQVANGCDVIV